MSCPIRGIGAREPDSYELEIGWIWLGFNALQRVTFVEPDANDPETVSLEIESGISVRRRPPRGK